MKLGNGIVGSALIFGGVLAAQAQAAEIVTALAIDPTRTAVYYQFSVDQPAEAYRIIIKDSTGAIVKNVKRDPAGTFMGHSGKIGGLMPDTDYVFNIRVQWTVGGPFTPEWAPVPFHTNP